MVNVNRDIELTNIIVNQLSNEFKIKFNTLQKMVWAKIYYIIKDIEKNWQVRANIIEWWEILRQKDLFNHLLIDEE